MQRRSHIDFSVEAMHDEVQRARLDFLATPCERTGETYRRRFVRFYQRFNGGSVDLDAQLQHLDRAIARAIEIHEQRTGRAG